MDGMTISTASGRDAVVLTTDAARLVAAIQERICNPRALHDGAMLEAINARLRGVLQILDR